MLLTCSKKRTIFSNLYILQIWAKFHSQKYFREHYFVKTIDLALFCARANRKWKVYNAGNWLLCKLKNWRRTVQYITPVFAMHHKVWLINLLSCDNRHDSIVLLYDLCFALLDTNFVYETRYEITFYRLINDDESLILDYEDQSTSHRIRQTVLICLLGMIVCLTRWLLLMSIATFRQHIDCMFSTIKNPYTTLSPEEDSQYTVEMSLFTSKVTTPWKKTSFSLCASVFITIISCNLIIIMIILCLNMQR